MKKQDDPYPFFKTDNILRIDQNVQLSSAKLLWKTSNNLVPPLFIPCLIAEVKIVFMSLIDELISLRIVYPTKALSPGTEYHRKLDLPIPSILLR